jgi:hypothetical protein
MADQPNQACRQSPAAPTRDGRMARAVGFAACQTAIGAVAALTGTLSSSAIPGASA